ncbi:hypothetical protein HELRODRAFT_165440 [Helobdella robusta]|uniref:Uncharacterized protein n=1 Tax=Helobdella robusta TaxID=6412 RepID=T1EWS8_HELRO|nr:hypothetical protein HELRODRAFT_165440 [Helobdella robusta]ESN91408.1 hypothetical protein HELRODRAFT_165440 [Helobdella robusta]
MAGETKIQMLKRIMGVSLKNGLNNEEKVLSEDMRALGLKPGLVQNGEKCKKWNALETPEKSDKNLELSPPPQREQASFERLDSNIMETPLIEIKLPKTLKHWTGANTYFQLHRTSLPNVSDINHFTTSFKSLIYNYFASNYGTKDLKQLKLLGRNDHSFDMKISTLSKQIRTKLLSMKNAKTEKHVDITKQLKVKFWSTCKKLFNPSNSLTPSFRIDDCKKYFYNILHDPFHNKFRLPNWVPTLQQPTIPCNINPPTYHEIATVIRKCKHRTSPCLLDQISIIVFKKCPMLRTIPHQLIVKCWKSATIPSSNTGIKLPKLSTQWSEANAFFQLEFRYLDVITDIDSFANSGSTTSQFNNNFWKSCKSSFSSSPNTPPQFSVVDASNFYRKGLIADNKTSFELPEWIPPLPPPSFAGDTGLPFYNEVASIVKKCKAKATPCPLDRISTIALKRDVRFNNIPLPDHQRKLLINANQDIEMGGELFFPILWFSGVMECVVEGGVGAVVVGMGDGIDGAEKDVNWLPLSVVMVSGTPY